MKRRKPSASSFDGLAFPKGPTRQHVKELKDAAEAAQIKKTRALLWVMRQTCACCGETEIQTRRRSPAKWTHEMHEDPSRAETKGRPPEERFNLVVCMRICPPCHRDYTANELRCVAKSEHGWLGPYNVERKNADREWVVVRMR